MACKSFGGNQNCPFANASSELLTREHNLRYRRLFSHKLSNLQSEEPSVANINW